MLSEEEMRALRARFRHLLYEEPSAEEALRAWREEQIARAADEILRRNAEEHHHAEGTRGLCRHPHPAAALDPVADDRVTD